MNKGIRKAQGEYCLFLNSGDYLFSSKTLNAVYEEISGNQDADVYYSDLIKDNGSVSAYPQFININYLIDHPLNHQNTLIKRSLFLNHGLYNEDLKIISDWEYFLLELWKYKSIFFHIKNNISVFDTNGISSLPSEDRLKENKIMYVNVFQELSETIIEICKYHRTTYYDINKTFGHSKLIEFFLRSYRFIIRHIRMITS
jgi:hypothetical protein